MPKPSEITVKPKDKFLPRLTTFFFNRPRITAFLWIALTAFGILTYTSLLRREGFPSIQIPIAIVSGSYVSTDPSIVDQEAAKPLSDIALKQANVATVQTQSGSNFFTATIQFDDGTDAQAATDQLKQAVAEASGTIDQAQLQFNAPYFGATGGDIERIDIAASFYATNPNTSPQELVTKARQAADQLNSLNLSTVQTFFVKDPFGTVTNPLDGQTTTIERNFDRYGEREQGENRFFNSVIIAAAAKDNSDVIEVDEQVRNALTTINSDSEFNGYEAAVSASFAPNITDNISELQKVLLEGLIAVLVVGSIIIAIRASFITVIAMVTVIAVTLGLLFLIGYTLNVITLFAIILGLSLIVDDTIIMVEAIDAARKRQKSAREAVREATRKVSRAMIAATLTAALCFAPLIFVGGVLGSFIRAIPITIIASLLISLLVALVFIPFFARFLLLGKEQMGQTGVREVGASAVESMASALARPMLWAKHSKARLFGVGLTAIAISVAFILGGLLIARGVAFNIFPSSKDTNNLQVVLTFPNGTSLNEARQTAQAAELLIASQLGDNFVQSSYYGLADERSASLQISIKSYNDRDITSSQIVDRLQADLDSNLAGATANVAQIDLGPPSAPFVIEIDAEDREAALALADDVAAYLNNTSLTRTDGQKAKIVNVNGTNESLVTRVDGQPIVTVTAGFEDTDTTTLVTLAQAAVTSEFPSGRLQSEYGLAADAINFNLGQEAENQDSFKTLALAFPLLLLAIYILLVIEFRSLLQPLIIFMAIPFSIFGVMFGLRITNNPISFFAMLGFFALIGLSIKNTILLTDFANQAKRAGAGPVDAAVAGLTERFRPLVATSLTAIVSLIPLALTSPFWEGLAVVLIFGLLSSTLLVLVIFPYYYLGAEYLRSRISAKKFLLWALGTVIVLGVTLAILANL